MGIIVDLIIIGLILLSVFLGYKKGLAKSLIKILSFFIAIIIAAVFYKPVSNFVIEKTQIDENIKQSIVNIVKDDIEETGEVKEESNLPKAMTNYINESVKNAVNETKEKVVENAAEGISVAAINVGVAVGLFVIVRILLLIVSLLSDLLTDLPVLKQFDKTGGVIYGLLRALIVIFLVFAVISFISPLIEETGIIALINKSFVGSLLYDNNLLLKIIF